jgi:hypothetical protein
MKIIKKLIVSLALVTCTQANEFYRDEAKEVVFDSLRQLMWQDDEYSSDQDLTYIKAKAYCEASDFAGYDDWYLPRLEELKTIVDVDNYPKTIKSSFKHIASEYYWSSSEYGDKYAWMVLFRNGSVDYYYKRDTNHLRCVRKNK